MTRAIRLSLFIAAMTLLQGCTHNNGDIGRWFGTWAVEQILVDGEPSAEYHGNMVWKFQDSVFSMLLINPNSAIHDRNQRWGSWEESDNAIIISFTHSDDSNDPGEGIYAPFDVSLLNRGGVSVLNITEINGNHVTLLFTDKDGRNVTYQITKQ